MPNLQISHPYIRTFRRFEFFYNIHNDENENLAHIFITDFEDWELLKIETIKKVLEKAYHLVIENLYF